MTFQDCVFKFNLTFFDSYAIIVSKKQPLNACQFKKGMNINMDDIIQRKARIQFKLISHIYHEHEKAKLVTIVKETGAVKSEVTKYAGQLIKEGLLEKNEKGKYCLTEKGNLLAIEKHRNYEVVVPVLSKYCSEERAKDIAEAIVMLLLKDAYKTFMLNTPEQSMSAELEHYGTITGQTICELMGNQSFGIEFIMLPFYDPTQPSQHPLMSLEKESESIASSEKTAEEFLSESLEFYSAKQISMANRVFLHPGFCEISDKKGFIRLHRTDLDQNNPSKESMHEYVVSVWYYHNGDFIELPIIEDNVRIPLECFQFIKFEDCFYGQLFFRFKPSVKEKDMGIRIAKMVIKI